MLVSERLFTLLCNKAQTCICFNAASKIAIAAVLLNKVSCARYSHLPVESGGAENRLAAITLQNPSTKSCHALDEQFNSLL
jgi:hypothetical protein